MKKLQTELLKSAVQNDIINIIKAIQYKAIRRALCGVA